MSTIEFNDLYLSSSITLSEEDSQTNSKIRRFKGIAYSGKPIAQHGFYQNLIVDMANPNFKRKIPIFRDHNSEKVIGHARLFVEDNQLSIEGTVVKSAENAKEILDLSESGFEWELSIGASPEYMEKVENGVSVEVNGFTVEGEAHILRNPRITEVSFVPIGADPNTHAQILSKKKSIELKITKEQGVKEMELTIINDENLDQFEFACGCEQGKGKASSVLERMKKLEEEKKALLEEIKALKSKSKLEEMMEKVQLKGLSMTEEAVSKLMETEGAEVAFEALLEALPTVEVATVGGEEKKEEEVVEEPEVVIEEKKSEGFDSEAAEKKLAERLQVSQLMNWDEKSEEKLALELTAQDPVSLQKAADLLVKQSEKEGMPISFNQAMLKVARTI